MTLIGERRKGTSCDDILALSWNDPCKIWLSATFAMTLRRGEGGGPEVSVIMTLIFEKWFGNVP